MSKGESHLGKAQNHFSDRVIVNVVISIISQGKGNLRNILLGVLGVNDAKGEQFQANNARGLATFGHDWIRIYTKLKYTSFSDAQ